MQGSHKGPNGVALHPPIRSNTAESAANRGPSRVRNVTWRESGAGEARSRVGHGDGAHAHTGCGVLVGEAMDDQGRAHTDACEAQYLGDYTGQRGALGDFLGYLQSLYPQGCEHQLLLGREEEGGREVGGRGHGPNGGSEGRRDGLSTDSLSQHWACPNTLLPLMNDKHCPLQATVNIPSKLHNQPTFN